VLPQKNARWLIRFSHILFLISILALLATGLRIAVANEPSLVWMSMALPQGDMHPWHFRFAFLLSVAIAFYVFALWIRRALPARNAKQPATRLFQWTHYLGLFTLTIALISGAALYFALPIASPETVLTIHLVNAFGFIAYLIVHGSLAFFAQGWRRTLRVFNIVKGIKPASALVVIVLGLAVFAVQFWLPVSQTLVVEKTNESFDLDGDARESIWQRATPLTIQTYQGYQQPSQGTTVTVKSAHDGESIYFLVSWQDDTRSQTHLPLLKTEEGWTILQTNAFKADENQFYEDKLAIMLSESAQLAGAGTVQLGNRPIKTQPAPPNQRGLHYTTDGSVTDVWHWKSVRTGLSIGQVDDNFFGPPTPSNSEYKRYTGGYQKDLDDCEHLVRWDGSDFQTKPECGGFVMNWKLFEPGIVTPIRLPKNPSLLKRLGQVDLEEATSDYGAWWLDWSDTISYHPDDDTYPVGTIMPSVLSLGAFTQGRGDVSAAGYWRDGVWQLELKRKLDTQSEYDLPIVSGTNIWFATFDHSQTRHSYHIRPVEIELR
jgi:Ni,Fe-hydrogenase I cytochrome b subunit